MRKKYYTPQIAVVIVDTESILQYSLQKSSDRADIEIDVLSRERGRLEDWDGWMDD